MAIADKIKLSSTKVLTAKSVDEIDELLVEMKQLFEENSRYSADVSIQWDRVPGEDMTETHSIKFKSLQEFEKLVRTIHGNEENFIDYVFSATIKLKLEKKDKEAERALKEKELDFFSLLSDEHYKVEAQEFEKITFTHRQNGVEGETVELTK
jgi:hypothetical protein